jgi:hypothetical protein
VQFTRDPGGLKQALLKIAGLTQGSRLDAPQAEQAAHMFFAPALKRMFATHPPLEERIKALDPRFDVRSLPRLAAQAAEEEFDLSTPPTADSVVSNMRQDGLPERGVVANADGIAGQVGTLDTVHIEHAHVLRLALPRALTDVASSAERAKAVVLALLLSRDPEVQNRQLTRLARALEPGSLADVRNNLAMTQRLAPMLRLPSLLHVFPNLRRLSRAERIALCAVAEELINADARIEVFEFCLARLLETLVQDELEARAPHGRLGLHDVARELQLLFSTLAEEGAVDEQQARHAFQEGMRALGGDSALQFAFDEGWTRKLGAALVRLDKLDAAQKRTLIGALVDTISHDGILSVSEAELLRTVCAILHCPLPPLLPGARAATGR